MRARGGAAVPRVGDGGSRRPPQAQRVTLRPDGSLRLGVVADTHSQPHPRAADHLAALAPDAILHAGDIGDLQVLDQLARIAPVYAIRGNIDVRARELPDALTLDVVRSGDDPKPVLRLLLVHIGVYGPKLRGEVAATAHAHEAQVVVCGHSHVPFLGRDRDLIVFNPGSIGPRRFHLPIVFGTIDVTPAGLRLVHVDCETGSPWTPP
jgi:putative phosphoesterase